MPTARRPLTSFLGPEFNGFLFAKVGTDRQSGQLSVLSALARLDLDAWAEAAALARLPRGAAIAKLSGMLRRFTEIPCIAETSGTVAARLVALLPGAADPAGQMPASQPAAGAARVALIFILTFGLLLGTQYAAQKLTVHVAPDGKAATAMAVAPGPSPAVHHP